MDKPMAMYLFLVRVIVLKKKHVDIVKSFFLVAKLFLFASGTARHRVRGATVTVKRHGKGLQRAGTNRLPATRFLYDPLSI